MNAQHSCDSAEWGTPPEWIERVRSVLGTIDLDPASSAEANDRVRAERYFSREDDGLQQDWSGRIFLNPPGGRGIPQAFWRKLVETTHAYRTPGWVYLAYSLEQLKWFRAQGLRLEVAIPRKRIAFVGAGSSPTHANAFLYYGAREERFRQVFGGQCLLLRGNV